MKRINRNQFHGTFTALVTPFNRRGRFDRNRFGQQIERQIAGGVEGIVPVGTTGESPTLSHERHMEVIRAAVEIARGRVKVIAGTGSNATSEAIDLTQSAEKAGADASLQVSPYYNKPSQRGLIAHFGAIAQSTGLPIILYNIPGRCGVDMAVDTVYRLKEKNPNIVGIKEASGSSDRVTELLLKLGNGFSILSGDDSLTLPFMSVGANGVISVVSNILPRFVSDMVHAMEIGDVVSAKHAHERLYPLTKSLFLDGNPVGVECAMELLGWDSGVLRLPLVKANRKTRNTIRRELQNLGLF